MESQKFPKRLDRDDRPRNRTPFRNRLPKKHPQAFPNTATQFREKRTIIKKTTPEDIGDAEDEMAMGDFSQNLSAHPFTKLHHPLLVAGRTEVSAFVPLRRDFRFASTQRPEDIHGRIPHIGPGQSRYAEPHSLNNGRSQTAGRDGKTHRPAQNAPHKLVRNPRNDPQHTDNRPNSQADEGGRDDAAP